MWLLSPPPPICCRTGVCGRHSDAPATRGHARHTTGGGGVPESGGGGERGSAGAEPPRQSVGVCEAGTVVGCGCAWVRVRARRPTGAGRGAPAGSGSGWSRHLPLGPGTPLPPDASAQKDLRPAATTGWLAGRTGPKKRGRPQESHWGGEGGRVELERGGGDGRQTRPSLPPRPRHSRGSLPPLPPPRPLKLHSLHFYAARSTPAVAADGGQQRGPTHPLPTDAPAATPSTLDHATPGALGRGRRGGACGE